MALTMNSQIGPAAVNKLAVGGVRTGTIAEAGKADEAKELAEKKSDKKSGKKGDTINISKEGRERAMRMGKAGAKEDGPEKAGVAEKSSLTVKMGKPGEVAKQGGAKDAKETDKSSGDSKTDKAKQLVEQIKQKIEKLKKEIEELKKSADTDETKKKQLAAKNAELAQLNGQLQVALKEQTKALKGAKSAGGAAMTAT